MPKTVEQKNTGSIGNSVTALDSDLIRERDAADALQSEKMAAIATLAAEIAHEINNPLHYISNYLYLLTSELPKDFKGAEFIEKIQGGIDALAGITRALLDFSRPIHEEFAPVNIHASLDAAWARIADAASASSVEMHSNYMCGDATILGSDRMLQQVFVHIFQNAIDAMPAGGRLDIATACSADTISVEIADSGTGIAAASVSRVFDPYFSTKKTGKKGAGLGLSVSFAIVKQHGGQIHVSSREGKGATFIITLPNRLK